MEMIFLTFCQNPNPSQMHTEPYYHKLIMVE